MIPRSKTIAVKLLIPGLLFLAMYVYLLVFNRYHILNLEQNQLFRFNMAYLKEFFSLPGALPLITGSFFTQFFVCPWVGALIITLNNLAVYLLTGRILAKYNITGILIPFVTVWLLTILQSNELFTFGQAQGFLLSLIFSAWCISIGSARQRRIIFLVIWPVFYILAGGFSILAAAICALHELLEGKEKLKFLIVLFFAAEVLCVPWLSSRLLFYIPHENIFTYPVFFQFQISRLIYLVMMYIWIPLMMLAGHLLKNRLTIRFIRSSIFKTSAGALGFMIMFFIIYRYAYERKAELLFGIDHYVREAQWDKVLQLSEKFPDLNSLVIYYTNLALLNSGQIGEKMFSYPQAGPQGLRLRWARNQNVIFGGEVFYYLSYNNEAYRWAFESMVAKGPNPRSLKRLIITSITNGDIQLARKFLNILDQAPFYRKWAGRYEKIISGSDTDNIDPEIALRQEFLISEDFISDAGGMNLDDLLKNHPENKKAYEYQMASFLLAKEIDSVAVHILRLKDYGYKSIPRNFEEAIVFYNFFENKDVIPEGYSFSRETVDNLLEYAKINTQYLDNRPVASRELKKKFGNTYWYYLQFTNY